MVIDQSSFHQTSWNHFCQSETVQFSVIPLKSFNGTKIRYWVSIQLVAILNSVFFRPIVSMRVWFGIFNWSLSGSCTAVSHKNESLLSLSFLHPIHLRPFIPIFLHPIFSQTFHCWFSLLPSCPLALNLMNFTGQGYFDPPLLDCIWFCQEMQF